MTLRTLRNWLGSTTRKRTRRAALPLWLEPLEERATPAAVSWDGGGGNLDWFNRLNWSNDALPTLADDVTISGAAGAVQINNTFGLATAHTLTSSSDLSLITGTLQLAGDSSVTGAFTLGGSPFDGVVTGSGTLTLAGNVTWAANGVMAGTGTTVLEGTSTLAGSPFGSLRESRVVENAGNATVLAGSSFTFRDNAVLHNRAGGTLAFSGGAGIGTFFATAASRLVNDGTLVASGPGTTGIGVFTENSGTIDADGANLNLTGLENPGTVDVTGGSLNTGANFANAGTVELAGGTLTVGPGTSSGAIRLSGNATMVVSGTAFTPPFTLLDGATVTGGPIVLNTFEQLGVSGTATADAVRLVGGTLSTLAGSNLTVGTLEHNGTVTGPGTVTVTDQWAFTNGKLTGGALLVTQGASSFSGGFFTTIDGATVENFGTAVVGAGASFTFAHNASWTNRPGSVFEVQSNALVDAFFISPTARLLNQGTVLKTGPGSATVKLPVVNDTGGTVRVAEGTLLLSGGGSSAGTFDVAAGDTLSANAAFTLQTGASGIGAGEFLVGGTTVTVAGAASLTNLRIQGGTLTVNAPLTVGNLTHSGTLTGPATVTVNGALVWTGGSMTGTGKTILNGTGTIGGSSVVILDGRTVDNAGTVTVTATSSVPFQLRNAAVWNNLSGAILELAGTGTISSFFVSATAAVNNAGTIRKSGAAGVVSAIGVPVINTGLIEILGGDLTTAPNSRSSGIVDIASAGRWVLNNGVTFLDAGAATTGAGLLLIQGGSLTVTGTASIARLQQNTSTTTVNAPLTVGDYLFNAGTLTGTGKTTLTGMSSFTGFSTRVISSHTVENAGTVTWSQTGPIQLTNGAVFNNLAGALFDITGDGSIAPSPFGGALPAFNNAGTLRKSGGNLVISNFGPRTTWSVPLTNSGTLDVRTGNFAFAVPFGLPAGVSLLTNTGTIQVGTASSPAAGLSLPATAVFPNPASYTLTGGTLTGTGQVFVPTLVVAPTATLGGVLTVNGNVENRGTVHPDSVPGALTVTGNYTQVDDATADGRLVIGLRGSSASGLFGKLQVNGQSRLAGALEVFAESGFLPNFRDVFQVFRSIGPRTGDFTYPPGGYDLDGYRVLTPEYDGTGLRLNLVTEVGALPVIDPIANVTLDEGQTVAFMVTVRGAEPPGPLTFALAAGSSPGATIDPMTGAFAFFAADGPGEYVFQVAVSDPNAPTDPVDVEMFTITVLNVAPTVTLTGGQSQLNEGDAFTAAGSFADPGADTWTATIDYGDGTGVNPLALNGKTFTLDHRYLDNGSFTITVRVFDGFEYGTATFDVAVANLPPVVAAADDQVADEGAAHAFDLGSFTDFGVSDAPWTVTVNWGDGSDPLVFQTTAQGLLDPRAHTFADNRTYTVIVQVTDKDGAVASDSFAVTVANVAPVAVVSGPASGVRGQARTFTLAATDPSPVDQAAGFTFSIDWGDGNTQQVAGLSGQTVEHTFTDTGSYTVTVTAIDKDGGVSEVATGTISVVVAEVQDGVLVVGGTTGADQIQLKKGAGDGASLAVVVNGVLLGEFDGLTRAVVYGQDGDDDIDATGSTDVALELYGGGGNDRLQGGAQDDVLDGGTGDDELIGGQGRDVLVGGAGADRLIGQNGDDLLIAGVFVGSDLTEARQAALRTVADGWSSGLSFDERMAALTDFLAARVRDDGVADSLTGSSDADWYFARTSGPADALDMLAGVTPKDAVTSI